MEDGFSEGFETWRGKEVTAAYRADLEAIQRRTLRRIEDAIRQQKLGR